jgi:CelD/BcsL family acetyltransferase involved in cellulose biosynthesis
LHDYARIYASSWKTPEPFPQFIDGLARACAEAGWLRLGIVYIDEQPAAAQIWIVTGGIATIYKLAYDERYARLSLGTILTAHLMEQVIDADKVHEVDYLTGDDAYKKDWMSDRRERWGIVAFNLRRPWGALAAMRHLSARMVRRAINSVRSLGKARA